MKKIFIISLVALAALSFVISGTHVTFAQSTGGTGIGSTGLAGGLGSLGNLPTFSNPNGVANSSQTPNLFSCSLFTGNWITCGVYFISYYINTAVGLFI